eukprot:TRINITY_DN1440_c0_g1_i1.p1 TRINITY_DN1440_c0_g1~~TRINITY_DN1440_c0_g1_i1.p1  ORF type:complete len:418 (-),score=76.94 TRINITY_DN1440_c0_g1_i1:35-1288(-)
MGHSHEKNVTFSFVIFIILQTVFFFSEIIFGILFNSIALISDAVHMFTDLLAVILAFVYAKLASKAPSDSMTFGFKRAEVVGGLVNAVFMFALSIFLGLEAIQRIVTNSCDIEAGWPLMIVAGLGLLVNIVGVTLFHGFSHGHSHGNCSHGHSHDDEHHHHEHEHEHNHKHCDHSHCHSHHDHSDHENENVDPGKKYIDDVELDSPYPDTVQSLAIQIQTRSLHRKANNKDKVQKTHSNLNIEGLLLHIIGDLLGSIGVLVAGALIMFTNLSFKQLADPIASLLISAMMLVSSTSLMKRASWILMQGVPEGIDIGEIKKELCMVPGVEDVHHIHVWQLFQNMLICSAHIVLSTENSTSQHFEVIIKGCKEVLCEFGIHESSLQPEMSNNGCLFLCNCDTNDESLCVQTTNSLNLSNE